jgi:outer membrane protein TolC
MLKINFSETPVEEKWILHGRLTAPWVRELRASWKKNHRSYKDRACIVDLNEITLIDKSGERFLRLLVREGAQCIASGVYIKHVLERLTARGKGGFINLLTGFFALAVLAGFTILIGPTAAKAQNIPFNGSVPSGPASNQVLQLSLRDAINTALQYNLGAIESSENARIARGQRLIALSNLLPQISAGASENIQQVNLATFGFNGLKAQGIRNVVGPFSYSSVDASISQTVFSLESIQRFRAARTAEQAAQLSYQDIQDVVTLTVGNAYLQIIEASSRIEAQEAQVRNAKALYDQAVDQVQAGTAPRIDATRTEVQLHTEEYNLSVARNNFEVAKLTLGRAIGLPLGQQFQLADALPYSDINPPDVDDALQMAYKSRRDFLSALDSQKAAAQTLSAAKGERYPTVAVNGDYGDIGPTFGQSHGIFAFQVGIRVPLFTGGRIKGDITQAEAALRQRKAEGENIRGQIDYDVRTAFLNLKAAREQVDVAKQNVALANENVRRSKDRFTSGVTDSVEVVQAEQALASANDQYITSLYNHNFTKLSLARALGVARTNYGQYLGGK